MVSIEAWRGLAQKLGEGYAKLVGEMRQLPPVGGERLGKARGHGGKDESLSDGCCARGDRGL